MASRGDVLCSLCLVQRSSGSILLLSGSILLLQEEAQHLAAGVRPPRVGVGSGLTSTRTRVAGPLENPVLQDRTVGRVGLDRPGIADPTLRLAEDYRGAQVRSGLRLCDD